MGEIVQFQVSPEQAKDELYLQKRIRKALNIKHDNFSYSWHKRSIDARKRPIKMNASFKVFLKGETEELNNVFKPKNVSGAKEVAIVGAGPAGLFAGLEAIQLGLKPVIFERGKDVRARRRDLAAITKEHIVNSESNYCFGEGGAGTYSDGKLYTRSKKKGDLKKILNILVEQGAPQDILIEAHPHIGTNKLPKIIQSIRETIIAHGGEVRFDAKVEDILIEEQKAKGVLLSNGEEIKGKGVILATGHSARDIFELLHKKKVQIHAKPFALGVRVEHPQAFINNINTQSKVPFTYAF